VKLLNSILKGRIIWKLGNGLEHVLFREHPTILGEIRGVDRLLRVNSMIIGLPHRHLVL
jgi:hypothetical protein